MVAKPHLALILADDLGWNMTGFSGNPYTSTPAMDQLVRDEGLLLYAAVELRPSTRRSVAERERRERGPLSSLSSRA